MSAIADFIGAMEAAGVAPAEPIEDRLGDGRLVRFRVHGDRASRRNGWAVLHTDGRPAGAFGSYRLGIRERWKSDSAPHLDREGRIEAMRRREAARREREAERMRGQADAADRAEKLWRASVPPLRSHPYLSRKGLLGDGVRQLGAEILVPMRDIDGKLWNVQRIDAQGGKLYLKAGRTIGLLWALGCPARTICIGEGMATMAAIRRATGHGVAAAFTYANLDQVARVVHARHPAAALTICADDDDHLLDHPHVRRNVGLDAARAAALAVGGKLALPPKG